MFNFCYCSDPNKRADSSINYKKCNTCVYNAFKNIDKRIDPPFMGNKYGYVT
jgi:surface antigen